MNIIEVVSGRERTRCGERVSGESILLFFHCIGVGVGIGIGIEFGVLHIFGRRPRGMSSIPIPIPTPTPGRDPNRSGKTL